MKLDGIGIFVSDMRTMVDFYKNILGFEIHWDGKEPNVMLKKDGVLFMFYGRNDFEKMTNKRFNYVNGINGHYEIALSVSKHEDVDLAYENIISKGVDSVMKPTTEPWGQRTCYIADPEGNLIEIGSFNK
ncbi:MAG: VOC family protein [Clostridium sp.]|jgi:catechol 2,3-dioxygenase-like lactoylglutathione lyase family enzyme|uniref:VOC family protein n=1 Tax=Clostridium sp. TaxID=1506 RepID=UPI0025BC1C39|nr:VOC family protein [Clostridium sp.]MCH3963896.1 VOC family protein [Clostridium sp.]MCI1717015.1 VOC family protein [Clostridium sp.]MCI1801266.1 VOC family protein [Clostridium sp.]MCI1815112.1 VOC family protein [Clostridium sp.]MCI1872104.1 VOC family protein [Clostridium sp.]